MLLVTTEIIAASDGAALNAVAVCSLVAAVIAAWFAVLGWRVMNRQLRAPHDLYRGIVLEGGYDHASRPVTHLDVTMLDYVMRIYVIGPGVAYEVEPWITGADGAIIRPDIEVVHKSTLEAGDEPIEIRTLLPSGDHADSVRWGARWLEPSGGTARVAFAATGVQDSSSVWYWSEPRWFTPPWSRGWKLARPFGLDPNDDPRDRAPG